MAKLVWYRNNLRTLDCTPLLEACEGEEDVHACFLLAPAQWKKHGWGPNRVEYTRRSVALLAERLAELNIPMHVFSSPIFDKAAQVISLLAVEIGCSEVHWSREYEVDELKRDAKTRNALENVGIRAIEHDDEVVVPPDQVRTQADGPFRVFTPYKRKWMSFLEKRLAATNRARPRPRRRPHPILPEIPPVVDGFEDFVPLDDFPIGEVEALHRLDHFLAQRVSRYGEDRNTPSISGTSGLSPCLATGSISPRTCVVAVHQDAISEPDSGPATWVSELAWRDFYRSVAFNFPEVCKGKPFKPETEKVKWRKDDATFNAWCRGRTGYPIVDAAMRALVETGWMHNRLRMITSQFLTKHLLIDWRKGEAFFARHLVDYDFASNNGGWQWSASTGTDAAPYFRVFNPTTQGRRFDAGGDFIRRYVPELAALEGKSIHEPAMLAPLLRGPIDYPDPVVEQSHGRNRAIAAFADASGRSARN